MPYLLPTLHKALSKFEDLNFDVFYFNVLRLYLDIPKSFTGVCQRNQTI